MNKCKATFKVTEVLQGKYVGDWNMFIGSYMGSTSLSPYTKGEISMPLFGTRSLVLTMGITITSIRSHS